MIFLITFLVFQHCLLGRSCDKVRARETHAWVVRWAAEAFSMHFKVFVLIVVLKGTERRERARNEKTSIKHSAPPPLRLKINDPLTPLTAALTAHFEAAYPRLHSRNLPPDSPPKRDGNLLCLAFARMPRSRRR